MKTFFKVVMALVIATGGAMYVSSKLRAPPYQTPPTTSPTSRIAPSASRTSHNRTKTPAVQSPTTPQQVPAAPSTSTVNYNGGYLISRRFCINSAFTGNPPSCSDMTGGHMTVNSGFLSGEDPTLTGTVSKDGMFIGKYDDHQGATFDVQGTFLTGQFQLYKKPILPENQNGVNITWTFQKL